MLEHDPDGTPEDSARSTEDVTRHGARTGLLAPRTLRIGAYALGLLVLVAGGVGLRAATSSSEPVGQTMTRADDQRASRSEVRPTVTPTTEVPTPTPTPVATTPAPTVAPTTTAPKPKATTPKATVAPKPAPVPAVGCEAYSGNRLIACNILPEFGFSVGEMPSLSSLWAKESGWSTSAANPSGAYGIPQALPGSKMASAGSDWRTNAATQIRWGLGYIKGRYGSPSGAWSYWQSHGWY